MSSAIILPVFSKPGEWVDRPDLLILAHMASPDEAVPRDIKQLYDLMRASGNEPSRLNALEQIVEKDIVRRDLRLRLLAGQLVLELVRIAATTKKPPSFLNGVRLTAYNEHRRSGTSSPEGLEREVRRGFQRYASTAHLQAAMIVGDPTIAEVEGSLTDTIRFLARARGLEGFMLRSVVSQKFSWKPKKIPEAITSNFNINIKTLSEDELSRIVL